MKPLIKFFKEISNKDVSEVGGKNASLGEMYQNLVAQKINVPDGFASTAEAYREFLSYNNLNRPLQNVLHKLNKKSFENLASTGKKCRELILKSRLPEPLSLEIVRGYKALQKKYGTGISLAVRSSATAEDLPTASFAGQQETYLNVKGEKHLLLAFHHCYASLFTNRAIKYRIDNGFEHMKVAISVGVQLMVRSDKASSGVMFTLDPDSGFENTILISSSWGLGENVVQGTINTDEFLVFKPFLKKVKNPVISSKCGSKAQTMIYAKNKNTISGPEKAIKNIKTSRANREKLSLSQSEVLKLSEWGVIIEKHYGRHMDIEWAKDGKSGQFFIVQARPETVHANAQKQLFSNYKLKSKSKVLCSGIGLGNKITSGKARILHKASEINKLQKGEILVTEKTDPDWDPLLKKAGAIITDQGGRTSHAAIVARESGTIAVVGTENATKRLKNGQIITVSAAEGELGIVYEGKLDWEEKSIDVSKIKMPETKPMLILGRPDQAFKYSFLPNEGIGLMRMEFIISNTIGIHPMALQYFDKIKDKKVRKHIKEKTKGFKNKKDFFIKRLAEATSVIAAAFYPNEVIVRLSDFKTNEYAHLPGGTEFEPSEENPMIGLRGASRYYHPLYRDGFALECKAMKYVREQMGFTNIKLMIPFCRTVNEAKKVIKLMQEQGLERGKHGLEVYMMVEIPSNAILADQFAEHFDGFSIGSNDLTQLTLGADRDSSLLSEVFDPFDPAVTELIRMTISKAKKAGLRTGLCGQAPSDYPEFAKFLVESGINSISFNPDAMIQGIANIVKAEHQQPKIKKHYEVKGRAEKIRKKRKHPA